MSDDILNSYTNSIKNVTASLLVKVQERYDAGGVDLIGTSTGFSTLDRMTGGLGPDEMWIVGGVAGTGKSSFALDIALATCKQDKGVIFYSLEMSAESLVNRLLASMTSVDSGRIIRGKMSSAEFRSVQNAANKISEFSLYIVDASCTSSQVVEHSKRIADRVKDVGLVVVDYAQLMSDGTEFGEVERVGKISGNIRSLARPDQLDVPVLLLSQLNRASQSREEKTPLLHDLKGASDLEQDAHVVLLLHRPHREAMMKGAEQKDVETDAKIIIAKSRNGPTGSTSAHFNTRTMTWSQP